jgi:hypothetical protein
MKLVEFLDEVRLRRGTPVPTDVDPICVILALIGMNPNSAESQALRKACLAVIACEGEMTVADLWALGKDARGLFEAFAHNCLTSRYPSEDLEIYARWLRNMASE